MNTSTPSARTTRPSKRLDPRTFVAHADGTHTAKFGRTAVTISPAGPRTVFRPDAVDGEWPAFGFRYQVEGTLTGWHATLDAAMAASEAYALTSEANARTITDDRPQYALTPERAAEVAALVDDDTRRFYLVYPLTAATYNSLRDSPHDADADMLRLHPTDLRWPTPDA